MSNSHAFLAFDLGASSGRAILGTFRDGVLSLEEMHRFDNGPMDVNGGLFWNVLGLFAELKTGLKKTLDRGVALSGIAIDTWGVDFCLLDGAGEFLGFPRCYRDPRLQDIQPHFFAKTPADRLYARTGIQFMDFNTVFQLAAMQRAGDAVLPSARHLLFMPNALTYLFCGRVAAEYTIASTGALLDPAKRGWDAELLRERGFPPALFPELVQPCTLAGTLRPAVCAELNCAPLPVYFVGSHDTASAVAAVPASGDPGWAYLSSGTWSLLGMELDQPCVTSEARRLNYTNEGGVGGKIRFLKNIMGLWLVQELRNTWKRQGRAYSFSELAKLAETAEPFRSLVDPNDNRFLTPGDMPARFQAFCRETGQPVPETPGQMVRCALESLALRYRQTVEELETLTGTRINRLHAVGGGIQNLLLNQFTANALKDRPVITGPVEGTAIGNLLCQAIAAGLLPDLGAARDVVHASFPLETFRGREAAAWDAAYTRFRGLK